MRISLTNGLTFPHYKDKKGKEEDSSMTKQKEESYKSHNITQLMS
jgi:hypothetical protein